ncbi:MAG: hypothetical protein BMS9Abin07_1438 [Acidimicrobiia bacterium]|nr:MAG: hypothetical protein BMS9Abin07_1438 [Acidimicrobiia bacterium]
MRTLTRILAGAGLLLVLSACGAAGPLDGLGDASSEWLQEGAAVTSTTGARVLVEVGNEGLVGTADLLWANDDLGTTGLDDPLQVIQGVWDRRVGTRFVQASRSEVATALPTIRFPSLVSEGVQWVTSQLVYDPATGQLDANTSAAFGLWSVEPYTAADGQLGVLRVGEAPGDVGTARSDTVPIVVPDGVNLGWTEGGLRYEMFCRASIPETACEAIIDSFVPLSTLLAF